MLNFKEYLTEAFNSPYRYNWTKKEDHLWTGEFRTKDDDWVTVSIKLIWALNRWELRFSIFENEEEYANTNKFDAFQILSTVVMMTKEFVKEEDPPGIRFTGSVEEGKDKLYKAMLKKFNKELSEYGYTTKIRETPKYVQFVIVKVSE